MWVSLVWDQSQMEVQQRHSPERAKVYTFTEVLYTLNLEQEFLVLCWSKHSQVNCIEGNILSVYTALY